MSAPDNVVAERLRAQARAAWRRGTLFDAVPELGVALLWVLVAGVAVSQRSSVLVPALLLLGLTAVLVLVPHASRRLVLPALLLGALPLGCALVAQSLGHSCGGEHCATVASGWCAPLCGLGGLGSGALLARAARHEPKPWRAWLLGGGLILATGAMGCGCVGALGLIGLVLGFVPSAALVIGTRSAEG